MPIVLKSESLNLVEPSGPVQACTGIAWPFTLKVKRTEAEVTAFYTIIHGLYRNLHCILHGAQTQRLSLLRKSVTPSLRCVPTDKYVRTRDPQNGCQRKLVRTLWYCRFQIRTSSFPVISKSTVAGVRTSEVEQCKRCYPIAVNLTIVTAVTK
jgi:hypothetical protein